MKWIIGVDPGVNGGMALLDMEGKFAETYAFTGQTVEDVALTMRTWSKFCSDDGRGIVYLEKVGFIKGDGGKGSFTFGKVYGGLLFGFKCLGLTVVDVPPVIWQSKLDCMTGGNKNGTKNRALSLFPSLKITHAVADALLIAEFGRRQWLAERGVI